MKKLCDGKYGIWENAGIHRVRSIFGFLYERPTGVKRKRLKCPKCGRKVKSSVMYCHDGCCILHYIPSHKPKGWWKK